MSAPQVYRYDDPFRPIYEFFSISVWVAAGIISLIFMYRAEVPSILFPVYAAICFGAAFLRTNHAWDLFEIQRSLVGQRLSFMTRDQLKEKLAPKRDAVFLGYGFSWTQEQAQLTHNIRRRDPSRLVPPHQQGLGQPWIHGIGMPTETALYLMLEHMAGHTLLLGTTRSGKTRMLDTIIYQAIERGEAVIIFDPKGDRGLRDSARDACAAVGRPNDFVYFNPAFPELSWRIDPLRNFNRASELATRIAALIPSETGNDPFTAHSQMILTNLCEGLLIVHRKPTIKQLKSYVDSGPEELIVDACEAFFTKRIPDWRTEADPFLKQATRTSKSKDAIANAYMNYYRQVAKRKAHNTALEALFGDFEHDKTHRQKMTASLTPLLTMLTGGTLGDLLSPDVDDLEDRRPITDFARIIRNRQAAYVGLDTLSDNMVGSAIGSIFVSEMTAVSGDRYNFGDGTDSALRPVTVIIDEAAELVSDKMIQLLNKAGGSLIRLVIATQTIADFSARVGSTEKARMVLGNLNNQIVLRTIDGATQEYIAESFPKTSVRHIEYSQATDAATVSPLEFGYRISESMKETEVPLVPPDILGCLPNLEFFAKVSAGRVIKGRIPILRDEPLYEKAA